MESFEYSITDDNDGHTVDMDTFSWGLGECSGQEKKLYFSSSELVVHIKILQFLRGIDCSVRVISYSIRASQSSAVSTACPIK